MALIDEIRNRKVRTCIMGLGYVGLPLALEFVEAGYHVVGLDTDTSRVESLREGVSYVTDIPDAQIAEALSTGRLEFTSDPGALSEVQFVVANSFRVRAGSIELRGMIVENPASPTRIPIE